MQPVTASNRHTTSSDRGRRIVKRLLVAVAVLGLLLATLSALTLIYYHRHPEAVKGALQTIVANATHSSCTITNFSYSLRRGFVRASGIRLKSRTKSASFDLQIAKLATVFSLSGSLGARRLVVKSVTIENFDIQLEPPFDLKNPQPGKTTAMSRLLTRMRRFWLFRDVVLVSASATSGNIRIHTPAWGLTAHNLNVRMDDRWRLHLNGAATFQGTAGAIYAVFPQFKITTNSLLHTDSRPLTSRLQLSGATLRSAAGSLKTLATAMELTYRPRRKQVTWDIRQLDCRNTTIFTQRELFFKTLSLQTRGFYDVKTDRLQVLRWSLDAGTLATLWGSASANLKPPAALHIVFEDGSLDLTDLALRLGRQTAEDPAQLTVSKPLALNGWLRSSDSGQGRQTGIHLTGRLRKTDVQFTDAPRQKRFRSRLSATIQVDGALQNPRISLLADLQQAVLHSRAGHDVHFSAALHAAGQYPRFDLSRLTVEGALPALQIHHRPMVLPNFKLSLSHGRIDVQRRQLDLPDVAIFLDPLKNIHLSIHGRPEHFRVALNGTRSRLLSAAVTLNLLPPAWQFKAADRFTATTVFTRGTWRTASVRLKLHDLSFSSPDGQTDAEKIGAEITARVRRSADGQAAMLHVQAAAGGGEILWGRFYANLAQSRPLLSADLVYDWDSRKVTLANARLSLKDLLQAKAHGYIDFHPQTPELALNLKVPPTAAAPLFKWLAVDPFEFDFPVLSALTVSGRLGGALHLSRRRQRWQMKGRILWEKGRLATADNHIGLQGIDMDLPFQTTGALQTDRSAALSGRLRVRRLHMPFLPEQPLSLQLLATPGRISASGLSFVTVGGKLRMGRLTADHIFGPQAIIKTSLTIPALQLAPFTAQLQLPPANAIASGKLDPLVLKLADGSLSGRGTIRIAAYDGTVRLQNPTIVSIFSPPPALMLNVALAGINLEKLTAGTSFGRIRGSLNGYVRHLEIVAGQPQRFDLLLETVKRKGVAQKISVTAVENISRIGGVPSPFVGLAGVFTGLLKSFSYRKIGIKATLANDVFHINGTIRKGGREYLVKKGGFSGVDVVNWNSDNRISFKDMLNRLKRIRSSHSHPVVK